MTTPMRYGRAGALALIGGGLCMLLTATPATAQCVGDCNGNGMVVINELVLGVNIDLGLQPVSACEAFANSQGIVDISQLVKGVNNALNGCPATPTATGTMAGTATATITPTLPIGNTPTATPTATQPSGLGSHTCTLTGNCQTTTSQICTSDASCPLTTTHEPCISMKCKTTTTMSCTTANDCPFTHESCVGGSQVALNVAALPVPLSFKLRGSIQVTCGEEDGSGKAECTCNINNIDPITINGIGTVCINPRDTPCDPRPIECNGGSPLGVDLVSNGNIGSCTGNDDCSTKCDTFCGGIGSVQPASGSGCIGFCTLGTMKACSTDADCLPDDGACNGPDNSSHNGTCQCQCLNYAAGAAARPGEMQCNLGSTLKVVATGSPCTAPPMIDVGSSCIPITTQQATTVIDNANFVYHCSATTSASCSGPGMDSECRPPTCPDCAPDETCVPATLPASGPFTVDGAQIACSDLQSSNLSALKLRGVVNFFGSALGDIVSVLSSNCQ